MLKLLEEQLSGSSHELVIAVFRNFFSVLWEHPIEEEEKELKLKAQIRSRK